MSVGNEFHSIPPLYKKDPIWRERERERERERKREREIDRSLLVEYGNYKTLQNFCT